jgi:hypothetical protein
MYHFGPLPWSLRVLGHRKMVGHAVRVGLFLCCGPWWRGIRFSWPIAVVAVELLWLFTRQKVKGLSFGAGNNNSFIRSTGRHSVDSWLIMRTYYNTPFYRTLHTHSGVHSHLSQLTTYNPGPEVWQDGCGRIVGEIYTVGEHITKGTRPYLVLEEVVLSCSGIGKERKIKPVC